MPITPKPLDKLNSSKKVTPHNFFFLNQKAFTKFQKGGSKRPPIKTSKKMPITPKPIIQLTSNKKVTPHNFLFWIKIIFKIFLKGGQKNNATLKTQKMPITPKPLDQMTSNKKVTPSITFYSESKSSLKKSKRRRESPHLKTKQKHP